MNIVQEVSSDRANSKVLSVGPRFESELFGLRGLGYKWSNIASLDTYSYSRKIDVGNLHDMPYENNSFDLVLAGFILAYSRKPMTAMKEIARVLRSGGKAIITWELPLDFDYKDTNEIFLYRTFNLNPKYELKRFTIRELLVSDLQLEKLFLTSLHPSSQPTEVILVVNKKG